MNTGERWNGREWEKYPLCQNAVRNTDINYGRGIGVPQCYNNEQEYSVTIYYSDAIGQVAEEDTVKLCKQCLAELKKSARKQGYKLTYRKIRRR